MYTEEKYKELKRKYVTLKDAVRHLHDDFGKVSAALEAKKTECASLEEQNLNLKKAYDSLTNELSYIKALKPAKPSGSTWENAMTMIKKGSQSASNTGNEDISVLYDELVSLKNQLEATTNQKEELLKQYQDLKNEHDTRRYEYEAGISKLKQRILALEGILKDLQGNLDASEQKSAFHVEEIASLKNDLEARKREKEKLEETVEAERRWNKQYASVLEGKLSQKLAADMRRLSALNAFNAYSRSLRYDWPIVRGGIDSLRNKLYLVVHELFKSWHAAFQFYQGSSIVTETILQNELESGPQSTADTARLTEQDQITYIKSGKTTWKSHMPSTDDRNHLWEALDWHQQKSSEILSELVKNTGHIASVPLSKDLKKIVNLIAELSQHQRLYFCLEEYLLPYEQRSSTPQVSRRTQQDHRALLSCFSQMLETTSKLYTRFMGTKWCIGDIAKQELKAMVSAMNKELSLADSSDPPNRNRPRLHSTDSNEPSSTAKGSQNEHCHHLESLMLEPVADKPLRAYARRSAFAIRELRDLTKKLHSAVSYRLCCPKIVGRQFAPLSGGSPQMIQFSSSISELESVLSLVTEEIIYNMLQCTLRSKRYGAASGSDQTAIATTGDNVDDPGTTPAATVTSVSQANSALLSASSRIKLEQVERNLSVAEEDRRQMQSCQQRVNTLLEELMVASTRCQGLEEELNRYRSMGNPGDKYASEVEKLFSCYMSHEPERTDRATVSAYTHSVVLAELQSVRESSTQNLRKLGGYIKHLVKTVNALEDSNRVLQQAVSQHVEQHRSCKETEESLRLNYSEQIALMSEHISELNASIMEAEYRASELPNALITCPACRSKESIGSLMAQGQAGKCNTCLRRLIEINE